MENTTFESSCRDCNKTHIIYSSKTFVMLEKYHELQAIVWTPFYLLLHILVFLLKSKYFPVWQQRAFLFRRPVFQSSTLHARAIKTKSIIIPASLGVGKTTGSIRRKLERAFSLVALVNVFGCSPVACLWHIQGANNVSCKFFPEDTEFLDRNKNKGRLLLVRRKSVQAIHSLPS